MQLYNLFRVYDYKGGELSSDVNLTKDSLVSILSDYYDCGDDELDELLQSDPTVEDVKKYINDCPIEESYYACADENYFTGGIYKVVDGRLRSVPFSSFNDDIAEYIYNNWIR